MTLLREALATNRATGRQLTQTYQSALLAEAYGKMGQAEEGLRIVAEALVAGRDNGRALRRGRTASAQR